MTLIVTYIDSGRSFVHTDKTQAWINMYVTLVSDVMQGHTKIVVTD